MPIKKANGNGNGKSIKCKIKFIDSFRFMSSQFPILVDNLSEKFYHDKFANCMSCLDYMSLKDDQLIFSCFECNKNHKDDFNKDFIKNFENRYQLCGRDLLNLLCYYEKDFIIWIYG